MKVVASFAEIVLAVTGIAAGVALSRASTEIDVLRYGLGFIGLCILLGLQLASKEE